MIVIGLIKLTGLRGLPAHHCGRRNTDPWGDARTCRRLSYRFMRSAFELGGFGMPSILNQKFAGTY
jgi:hypothetical protein